MFLDLLITETHSNIENCWRRSSLCHLSGGCMTVVPCLTGALEIVYFSPRPQQLCDLLCLVSYILGLFRRWNGWDVNLIAWLHQCPRSRQNALRFCRPTGHSMATYVLEQHWLAIAHGKDKAEIMTIWQTDGYRILFSITQFHLEGWCSSNTIDLYLKGISSPYHVPRQISR